MSPENSLKETQSFECPIVIQEEDIDGMGHVNNVVYLRWVQEVATAHWNTATEDAEKAAYAWVVQRHEIDYMRPALLGDTLVGRTRVGEVGGARFERFVEIWRISDNRLIAKARTLWVALDPRTGRPCRIQDTLRSRFHLPEPLINS